MPRWPLIQRLALGWLLVAAAFLPCQLYSQNPMGGKEPAKEPGKDLGKGMVQPKEPGKDLGKTGEPAKKPIAPLDKVKFPPGTVVVVVEQVKEAFALLPSLYAVRPEDYQALLDELANLKKQLKAEKKIVHSCRLVGKQDGDQVVLKGDIVFTTEQPRATVLLGFSGAQLTEDPQLDSAPAFLDFGDDGFLVKVDKEGTHHLTLNVRVPLGLKKTGGPGSSPERGFDLALPGAAVTTLALELPPAVKEVRWNSDLEKRKSPGRWELTLGKIKNVSLSWKEPVALPGSGPLTTAEGAIVVRLEEGEVVANADLTLEDLRLQTSEWPLILPPGAKVEVKNPAALAYVLEPQEKGPATHILRLKGEPTGERIVLGVQARWPRSPNLNRFPLGPFFVLGAARQQGTILIQAGPEALRGQRLLFQRHGEVYQKELAKTASPESVASFQYWGLPHPGAAAKGKGVPLELEFKTENSQVETQTDHVVRLRPGTQGWVAEVTTMMEVTASQRDVAFLEVQLPLWRPQVGLLGLGRLDPFSALGWVGGVGSLSPDGSAEWLEVNGEEGAGGHILSAPDRNRRARITFPRPTGKVFMVVLNSKYFAPAPMQHARLELPFVVGGVEKGGKATLTIEEGHELLLGPPGLEAPVVERNKVVVPMGPKVPILDIGWRGFRPEVTVGGDFDVSIYGNTGQVQAKLRMPPQRTGAGPLRFHLPDGVVDLSVVSGGKFVGKDVRKEAVWLALDAPAEELVLKYEFLLSPAKEEAPQTAAIPLLWPDVATQRQAKVRFWTEPGTTVGLGDDPGAPWRERGPEVAPGRDRYPALVLVGSGQRLPLAVTVRETTGVPQAALVCDRALVQVYLDEDGHQLVRARFLVRTFNQRRLDVELPLPLASSQLQVSLDRRSLPWSALETNVARLHAPPGLLDQPMFLELEYKLPAALVESRRLWQVSLLPPRFRGDVHLARVRWQVSASSDRICMVAGRDLRVDNRWGLQGWLWGPEAGTTSSELESWLTGKEAVEPNTVVAMTFFAPRLEGISFLQAPRQAWLLVCSSFFLVLTLGLYLLPLSRVVFFLVGAVLLAGLGAVTLLWPTLLPWLIYGCQPGMLVLLVILLGQWMLQESYRRQMVFLPGFTRIKPGSSLSRGGSSVKTREPSTVDAPAGGAPGATGKEAKN